MLKEIQIRRSVRKYRDEQIPTDKLESLLRAAMQAPSARNCQPWEFVVITQRALLKKIPEFHPYSKMVPNAGAAILVCGNTRLQSEPGYIVQDCSAAVQNLLLEAVHQNLGAVWLGVYPREERMKGMTELFDLPEHIIPVALISIGVPAEVPEPEDRFRKEKIHFQEWGRA
ncbi:MAG: nitroreductase family protein [Candidatus Aegiribacteria sp.]|nr:nitroreductase family protein [Candidatus Aegiribacteria sp.]